jgi:hypothetical protein
VEVRGTNVPKNIWGNIKINDNPVAVPELFEIDAVTRPKPTEVIERKTTKMKADKNPISPLLGLNPKAYERIITITTCIKEMMVFDMIWLPMNSLEEVGVVFILSNSPCSLSSVNA